MVTRVKQPLEYIIRPIPLSIKLGLYSSLIYVPAVLVDPRNWPVLKFIQALRTQALRTIVAVYSDRKPLFGDFGLCYYRDYGRDDV